MHKTISELFSIHPNTVTNWKKEHKKGYSLLTDYFSKSDLQEYLRTGSITKFDNINLLQNILKQSTLAYFQFFSRYKTVDLDNEILNLYLSFLTQLKNDVSEQNLHESFLLFFAKNQIPEEAMKGFMIPLLHHTLSNCDCIHLLKVALPHNFKNVSHYTKEAKIQNALLDIHQDKGIVTRKDVIRIYKETFD